MGGGLGRAAVRLRVERGRLPRCFAARPRERGFPGWHAPCDAICPSDARATERNDSLNEPPPSPLTILLAEDDANLRGMLAIVLRREGHRVVELRNGAELRDQLDARYRPDQQAPADILIISDLRMPEIDTLSLIRAVRERGHQPPFIMLTAFGSAEVHAAARSLGALRVLDKPFDFDELRGVVRAFRANESKP